jgi:hypothetical protein
MFKKIILLLALAFSVVSTVGATPTTSQFPVPQPPPGTGT